MRYYLDTEFNGFGGELISLALVPETGEPIYLALSHDELAAMTIDPWVERYVLPVMSTSDAAPEHLPRKDWARRLASYFRNADAIEFVADWPDDIRHLMTAITLKPGVMIEMPGFTISCIHIPSWPNRIPDAVRHNALWDARALREAILNPPTDERISA